MTDKDTPKPPAAPGMAEVSAEFVHEAEAAVEAAAWTDETLSALWLEHEGLRQQYSKAGKETDLAFTAMKAITDTETPEYHAAAAAHEAADQHQQETSDAIVATENRMAKVPARTVAGALLKLRVVGIEITGDFTDRYGVLDETQMDSEKRLTLSALADLERLAGKAGVLQDAERLAGEGATTRPAAADDSHLLSLERRWNEINARRRELKADDAEKDDDHPDVLEDERLFNERTDIEIVIAKAPAHTATGVAIKLRQLQINHEVGEGGAVWDAEGFRTSLEALEHLVGQS